MFDIEIKLIFNFLIFLLFIVIIKLAIYYGINHKTHINKISSRVYFIMAQQKYILSRCRSLYSGKNEKIWSIIGIERALRKHINTYVPLDCPLWSSFLPPLGNTVMSTFFLLSITCSDF